MNEKFYNLTTEKQTRILNAGYKVFSESPYRKAPVAEIAKEAGISKALLFHYFQNKKELYLYLWNTAAKKTSSYLKDAKVLETNDLFEMLRRNITAKCMLTKRYPYMSEFTMRAYFEQDAEIAESIQVNFERLMEEGVKTVLEKIDRSPFREDLDVNLMYREMILAADGYMHMTYISGNIDPDKIKTDLEKIIQFWETVYRK